MQLTASEAYEVLKTEKFKKLEKEIYDANRKIEFLMSKVNTLYPLEEDYCWVILMDGRVFPKFDPPFNGVF